MSLGKSSSVGVKPRKNTVSLWAEGVLSKCQHPFLEEWDRRSTCKEVGLLLRKTIMY